MNVFTIFVLYVINLGNTDAAKILCLFQAPFISHQMVFRSVTHELLARGHEVTVITTDGEFTKEHAPTNMTEIDVHDLTYGVWKKGFLEDDKNVRDTLDSQIQAGLDLVGDIIRNQYKSKDIQQLISDTKIMFDVIIAEGCFPPTLAFSYIYKVPVIQISTTGPLPIFLDNLGIPRHIAYYPNVLRKRTYDLTVMETYEELLSDVRVQIKFFLAFEKLDEEIRKGFISTAPSLSVLKNNIHMAMEDIHPIWGGIRPYPLNYVNVYEIEPKFSATFNEVCNLLFFMYTALLSIYE